MFRRITLAPVCTLLLGLLLAIGCGNGDGGNGDPPDPEPSNKWDEMKWDEGKWGAIPTPPDATSIA